MHRGFLVFFSHLILFLVCVISDRDFINNYASVIYAVQVMVFGIIAYRQEQNLMVILSPSFLTIVYISLNFIFGHYAVVNALGFDNRYYFAFQSYTNINFITFYFLLCNLIVFLCIPFGRINNLMPSEQDQNPLENQRSSVNSFFYLFFLLVALFIFGRVEIDLSFLGGEGRFNYSFEFATAIAAVLVIRNQTFKNRIVIYGALLAVFVSNHFDSKREILFLLIFLLLFESVKNNIVLRLKFKTIFISCIIAIIFVYIIILSSILRGYGNYNVENPIDAVAYVDDYLTSDFAKDALVMNFEITPVYGNSTNAINYVYNNEVDLLYGATFYKLFFVPVPRSIYPDKPDSMVDIYTTKFAPSFRAIGGSFPILLYSEIFWNFYFFGLLFLAFIFFILNRMYLYIIEGLKSDSINKSLLLYLFLYSTFIQFVRGAGLEMWLIYAFISFPLIVIFNTIFFSKNKK